MAFLPAIWVTRDNADYLWNIFLQLKIDPFPCTYFSMCRPSKPATNELPIPMAFLSAILVIRDNVTWGIFSSSWRLIPFHVHFSQCAGPSKAATVVTNELPIPMAFLPAIWVTRDNADYLGNIFLQLKVDLMVPEETAGERLSRLVRGIHCAARTCHLSARVTDPDPSDPHAFGPPGSGSICQRSGSVYHQAKIVRKTPIPNVLWLLWDILSMKDDLNVPSKSNKQKNFF
jgi:hypothetical protein